MVHHRNLCIRKIVDNIHDLPLYRDPMKIAIATAVAAPYPDSSPIDPDSNRQSSRHGSPAGHIPINAWSVVSSAPRDAATAESDETPETLSSPIPCSASSRRYPDTPKSGGSPLCSFTTVRILWTSSKMYAITAPKLRSPLFIFFPSENAEYPRIDWETRGHDRVCTFEQFISPNRDQSGIAGTCAD